MPNILYTQAHSIQCILSSHHFLNGDVLENVHVNRNQNMNLIKVHDWVRVSIYISPQKKIFVFVRFPWQYPLTTNCITNVLLVSQL